MSPDAAGLEEVHRQGQDVPHVPGDQAEIDFAADVGEQVLPQQAEEGTKHTIRTMPIPSALSSRPSCRTSTESTRCCTK